MRRIVFYIVILGLMITGFACWTQSVAAESWSGNCPLTSDCPNLIYGHGDFRSDGFYPTDEQGFAFFSSRDAGITSLDVAKGRMEFDVKGLDVRTLPFNSMYFGHIHRIPWNGCQDDFWYTIKLTGGEAGGTNGQIWAQGFDYATKILAAPAGGFPGGWRHVELVWDNTGWTTNISGVGTLSGVMNYELTPRTEEIMIGVGSEIDGSHNPVAEPENEVDWGYGLFDLFGDGIEVAYKNFEWEFVSGSTTNPNAQDSEFCIVAEDTTFGDCGCISLSNPEVAPCSEELDKPNELEEDLMWYRIVVLGWYWELRDVIDNFTTESYKDTALPEVWVQSATPGLLPGQDMSFLAAAEYYRTRYGNMYFAWCVRDSAGGPAISYNSVVAGGEVAELSDIPAPSRAGPCCNWLTRTPAVDNDGPGGRGDGMDDLWEQEKFVGREFNGEILYNSIEEVLPNEDPDTDGYYANRFENREDGEFVTVTPGLVDSLNNQYIPGASDARLTNVEEYILQTDPLNGDTDGDGFYDEEDYIGSGQQNLQFTASKFLGISGYMDVTAAVVGIDQRKLVYVAQGTQRVHVTPAEQFVIELVTTGENLPVGASDDNTVTVGAQISQGDVDSQTLVYSWTMQGRDICQQDEYPELAEYCGQGKSQLVLGGSGPLSFSALPGIENLEMGEDYTIRVDVIDALSRQESHDEIRLRRSAALELTTSCEGTDAVGEEAATVSSDGTTPVLICVGSYGVAIENESNISFQWYKDGHFEQSQTGIGKATYELYGTKLPGQIHTVHLTASAGELRDQQMEGDIIIGISGPHVTMTDAKENIQNSDNVAGDVSRYLPVSPGAEINLTAMAENFGEQANYEWSWSGGDEGVQLTNSLEGTSTYSFNVPESLGSGDSMVVDVQVRADDGAGNLTDGGSALLLTISGESGVLGSGRNFFANMAAVFSMISPQTKVSIQVALLVLGALGIIVLVAFVYRVIFVK
ncbi:hypothetical protein ACFL0Z_01120 [Patescibacteria group bacterium]